MYVYIQERFDLCEIKELHTKLVMTKRMSSLFGHENSSLDSPSITISNKQREHCNSAFDNRSTFSICAKLGQFSFKN